MTAVKDKGVFVADSHIVPLIGQRFKIITRRNLMDKKLVHLFIAVAVSDLPEYAESVKQILDTEQFRILFLREDMDLDWLPEQFLKTKLPMNKLLPKLLMYSDSVLPRRVMDAWANDSQHVLIASAFATNDYLFVSNCALEKLKVTFKDSPVLSEIPVNQRKKFVIDREGSFISWPALDIDLDFESLSYLAYPEKKKLSDASKVIFERSFGAAVASVRKLHNISQPDIASKARISERQLRRYENEGFKPRMSTLEKLAKAHDLELNNYLEELAQAMSTR